MSAASSSIARQSVGRTFIVAMSVLGFVAFTQIGAVGWVFVNRFGALTERAKLGPAGEPALPERAVASLPADEPLPNFEARDPFATTPTPGVALSSDPIRPPMRPVPISPSKLNPPAAPPETRFQELLQQGRQLRDRGDTGAALVKFREALALEAENPEVMAEIAVTFERMSLMDRAAEQWKRIYDLGDAAGSYFIAAESRLKMSQAQAIAAAQIAQGTRAGSEGPLSRLRSDAFLGVGEVTRIDQGETGGTRFSMRVPVKAKRGERVNVGDVDIHVLFYDMLDGKSVVQTSADVSYRFASSPVDWASGEPEVLEVEYSQQPSLVRGPKAEVREYHGYAVRVYYKGDLQDLRAEPENLNAKFPAPQTLAIDPSGNP